MTRLLDVGIIAACFGIFVSLSDFVISEDRKKKINLFIDGITLRLDYTKTLDWLQRWLKASRRASFATIFFAIISVILALAVVVLIEYVMWQDSPWWELILVGIATIWLWSWQWGFVAKAYEHVGVPILEHLADSSTYGELFGNYMVVIFGGAAVLSVAMLLLYFIGAVTANWWDWIKLAIGLAGNFVFGLILCWIGIIIDGIVTMAGALLVYIMRTIVEVARWCMWRISSYPKGPLTALFTLIGAVLAFLKMAHAR